MDKLVAIDKLVTVELYPDDSIFYIYDAALDFSSLNLEGADTSAQGFSGHPRSLQFSTLGECMNLRIELWARGAARPPLTPPLTEIVLREDTVRAIIVPFSFSSARRNPGFVVKPSLLGMVELQVHLAPNPEFALVFEIKLCDDPEYLNSPEYQEDVDGGFTRECCYLTFYPTTEPIQPEILRTDTWTSPPYFFNRYTPLNPTYPLVLDPEPTRPLPW